MNPAVVEILRRVPAAPSDRTLAPRDLLHAEGLAGRTLEEVVALGAEAIASNLVHADVQRDATGAVVAWRMWSLTSTGQAYLDRR